MEPVSCNSEHSTSDETDRSLPPNTKCRFCCGFYVEPAKNAKHNKNCEFRLSEVFLAFDGKIKFACTECRDVFQHASELKKHERRHKWPGGYYCSICEEKFLSDADRTRHAQKTHKIFKCLLCEDDAFISTEAAYTKHVNEKHNGKNGRYVICCDCGACFEQKSHLRLHNESSCGRLRSFTCHLCGAKFLTEHELSEHKSIHTTLSVERNITKKARSSKQLTSSESTRADSSDTSALNMATKHSESDQEEHTVATFEFIIDETVTENLITATDIKTEIDAIDDMTPNQFKQYLRDVASSNESRSDDCDESHDNIDSDDWEAPKRKRLRYKTPLSAQLYKCKYCEQKYTSMIRQENHIKRHGPNGELIHKCNCCSTYFATTEERKKHRSESHGSDLTCHICKKLFENRDLVARHVRDSHKEKINKVLHICTKCGTTFVNKSSLINHENSDCGRSPIYKCNQCGKLLHSSYTLRTHQFIHADEKSHLCTYCGKACRTKSHLKTHTRIHTGEKPYKCAYCERRFCDRSTKFTHETTHTGIKPYMCQCGDRFSCISNLQSHRRARKTTCGLLPLISKPFPQISMTNN